MKLIAPNPDTRIAFDLRYTPKPLLTPSEARFHECLDSLSQNRCRILCKPRLADVFQHHDLTGFNKVSQKHIDFLICRNEDYLEERNQRPYITAKGKEAGGEFRMSPKFGPYFIWPESLKLACA